MVRTEGALESKELFEIVKKNGLDDIDSTKDTTVAKKVAAARAIIIRGLSDRPLRLCLPFKKNPHKLWTRLADCYTVSNTATMVRLQAKLCRMAYTNESMNEYADNFEEIFNRMATAA